MTDETAGDSGRAEAGTARDAGGAYDLAVSIVRRLQETGCRALLVGGCVRDLLLGLAPKDYDVATSAPPERVRELFPKTVEVGAQFGVVLVVGGDFQVEVATFRGEEEYLDGRRPSRVYYADERTDALRRDFTVNGMFQDPISGEILDYVGGKADLRARLIRAIGDPQRRFAEDRLRMLRAVRLAAQLGFEIEAGTFHAIREMAGKITDVSMERIRDELVRILTGPDPRGGMELLASSGMLRHVLPEVEVMRGCPQPPEFHPEGDVWTHTLLMLDLMRGPRPSASGNCSPSPVPDPRPPAPDLQSPVPASHAPVPGPQSSTFACLSPVPGSHARGVDPGFALAVLLHDVGKPPTLTVDGKSGRIRFLDHEPVGEKLAGTICRRLRFPNEIADRVAALVASHMKFKDIEKMRPATLKRFLMRDDFEDLLELHRLDCLASHGNLDAWNFASTRRRELLSAPPPSKPLITGCDLIAAGYRPGPEFKRMLEEVETLKLEGRLKSRDDAMAYVRSKWPSRR
ncbi:MAG: HD domain-containing protein [Planctomycetota bacterium]|nr:HD domain-containing protein [Planctomycetota bacterium]